MSRTFVTTIVQGPAKRVTGIEVPAEVVKALGPRKNPAVRVTLNAYAYRTTVATMGGRYMVPLSAENRTAAGLKGDETLPVTIEADTEPRTFDPPADLKSALDSAGLGGRFEACSPSRQKEYVRQVGTAKASETRRRRIAKILDELS